MPAPRLRIVLVAVLALFLLGTVTVVAGGPVGDKWRTGQRVTVGADEVVDHDLYITGGDVTVDGRVTGDLVVFSGGVTINGTVEGDVVAGTGRFNLYGTVEGDARVGAGWMIIDGSIGEDLLAGSGQIDIRDNGSIGEDFVFGAGDVMISGTVEGSILGSASSYARTGTVGGSESVTIGEEFAPFPPGQPNEPSQPETPADQAARIAGDGARQWIAVMLFGGLAIWLVPGAARAAESGLRRRPLASVGMGIGVLVGYVIQFIAVILGMLLVAIAFGSLTLDALSATFVWGGILWLFVSTFLLIVAAAFFVDVVVGLAIGQLAARGWAQNRWQELALLAAGAAIIAVLTSLPGVGGVVKLVVVVLGLGAMTVAISEAWRRRFPPAAPAFAAAAVPGAPVMPPAEPPPAPPPPPAAAPEPAPAEPAPAPAPRTRTTRAKPTTDSTDSGEGSPGSS